MNNQDIIITMISLFASIASLVLAIVAIWLSFKFFEKSSEAAEKTNEASKGISASVERLEKLFDKLYSDTFSVMKDTVSDMRKHLWSNDKTDDNVINTINDEVDKKAENKILEIKSEISKELSQILEKQKKDKHVTDTKISNLTEQFQNLLDKAISESRSVEIKAREETIRDFLLKSLKKERRRKSKIVVEDLVRWGSDEGISFDKVIDELDRMKRDRLVDFPGEARERPDKEIELT